MPEYHRKRVFKVQGDRNRDRPNLKLTGVQGMTNQELVGVLNELIADQVTVQMTTVVPQKGGYLLKLPNTWSADRLLAREGEIALGRYTLSFSRLENKITLEEVFNLVLEDLRAQDKSASCVRNYGGYGNREPREERDDRDHRGNRDRRDNRDRQDSRERRGSYNNNYSDYENDRWNDRRPVREVVS